MSSEVPQSDKITAFQEIVKNLKLIPENHQWNIALILNDSVKKPFTQEETILNFRVYLGDPYKEIGEDLRTIAFTICKTFLSLTADERKEFLHQYKDFRDILGQDFFERPRRER